MARKVAGLDLSITATGVAHSSSYDDVACTHLVRPDERGDRRLVQIRDQVLEYVTGAELVLIEEWTARSFSAAVTGMVHGNVRDALLRACVPYATVLPAAIKKYATGSGRADKTAMALAAYKRAGLEFEDDNQCDAWWLWAMARDLTGSPVLDLPQDQRAVLGKIRTDRETAIAIGAV